jgi:hypothetical protein
MKKISFIFIIYVLFQACFLAFCYQSISEVELRNDFTDNTWYESDSNIVRNNTLSSYHLEYVLGGYESDGVLYFDNVLSGVNNTALWYVSNTTLNSHELNVEFSNDNITWDESTSLVDGLNVIFLESLNYSDLYMRHNFTNVASSTPYLNNVSIFYEGSGTGPEEITVIPFLGLLIVALLGAGLYRGKANF